MSGSKSTKFDHMSERISSLKDHYILCGAGFTGFFVAEELSRSGVLFVVVDRDPVALQQLHSRFGNEICCVQGDATEDDILGQAGIKRAKGLIAALGDDRDNVFTILTARSLNPELRIVTRVEEEENVEKLRQAGADIINDPNNTGGMRLASQMVRPEVVAFLDHMLRVSSQEEKLRLTEVPVGDLNIPALEADEFTIADIGQHTEFLIVAVKRRSKYIYRPRGGMKLHRNREAADGDVVVVIATQAQLGKVTGDNP